MNKIIEFQNVSKFYGELQILRNLDMHVKAGEKLAMIGPSGSGKTTILRILMTLETIDSGHVMVDSDYLWHQKVGDKLVPASEKHLHKMRNSMGMVFQQFNQFPHLTAIPPMIPPLANYLITMFKETTLFRGHYPMTLVGVFFLIVSVPAAYAAMRLEKKFHLKNTGTI